MVKCRFNKIFKAVNRTNVNATEKYENTNLPRTIATVSGENIVGYGIIAGDKSHLAERLFYRAIRCMASDREEDKMIK